MLKLFEWIYKLGIRHERRRVRLLITEYQNHARPFAPFDDSKVAQRQYENDMRLFQAVDTTINQLIYPSHVVEQRQVSPLDMEES